MATPPPQPLHDRLDRALARGHDELDRLTAADAVDVRDEVLALLGIHDLHLAPIDQLGERTRWQHHPVIAP